jgi:hypothetical protein
LSRWWLITIIVAGVAVRFALTPLYAHLPDGTLDEGFWKHWMEHIHRYGVLNIFRTTDTDYVGYHWVLWFLAWVYDVIGGPYTQTTPSLHILVKVPSIIFDVVLIVVVYVGTRVVVEDDLGPSAGSSAMRTLPLVAASVCAFHPAVLYDSAVWAQTDSAISAAMFGALVLAYRERAALSGVAFGLGFAVKPHPIIILPMLVLTLLRRGGVRAVVWAVAGMIGVLAVVLGPWLLHGDGRRIWLVYHTLFTKERERLSELAWNMWWIPDQRGDPRPSDVVFQWMDFLTYERLALGLSIGATALACGYLLRNAGLAATLVAAAYEAFAFYQLPIGSHERYLYPLLVLLLPVALVRRGWLLLYVPVSVTFFLNLILVAPPVPRYMDRYVYGDIGVATAAVNTLLFTAFTVVLIAGCVRTRDASGAASEHEEGTDLSVRPLRLSDVSH